MIRALDEMEATSFDAACALHWYCADHHDGQGSDLYRILSTLPYTPGPLERGPEGSFAAETLYLMLERGTLDATAVRDWIETAYDREHCDD